MAMPELPSWLSELLASPLVLPASVAGAVAALFVVAIVMAWRRVAPRTLFLFSGLVVGILAVLIVVELASQARREALRRDIFAREAELTQAALVTGTPLACLAAGAGDTVEAACEKSLFASAQSVASAVTYIGARLNLLAAAATENTGDTLKAVLALTRRAIELDRFGFAAHVLATRDGCTPDKCDAFSLVDDPSTLKANLKAQVFDQYVSRYVAAWTVTQPQAQQPPAVSSIPGAPPVAAVPPPVGGAPVAAIKPGEPWDYPSADSIPAVSIMNAEPAVPKGPDGNTREPGGKAAEKTAASSPTAKEGDAAAPPAGPPANKPAEAGAPLPPTPPKRPQQQAAPAAAR